MKNSTGIWDVIKLCIVMIRSKERSTRTIGEMVGKACDDADIWQEHIDNRHLIKAIKKSK